ncbi:hypothetical protein NDU88_002413 [Pleurodeles waltl]|uniref:Uncharacterized protein n=1 Tax=Pleurodeles waltl TaxID=8319 RepID=A0AAV7NGC0_PLEWA|nr:hypothetical protein NDU88_002413 [Pleurodeles waltl]
METPPLNPRADALGAPGLPQRLGDAWVCQQSLQPSVLGFTSWHLPAAGHRRTLAVASIPPAPAVPSLPTTEVTGTRQAAPPCARPPDSAESHSHPEWKRGDWAALRLLHPWTALSASRLVSSVQVNRYLQTSHGFVNRKQPV